MQEEEIIYQQEQACILSRPLLFRLEGKLKIDIRGTGDFFPNPLNSVSVNQRSMLVQHCPTLMNATCWANIAEYKTLGQHCPTLLSVTC